MKQKVTIYFKKEHRLQPLIIHSVDSVDILEEGKILRIYEEGKICYTMPYENIMYCKTELEYK